MLIKLDKFALLELTRWTQGTGFLFDYLNKERTIYPKNNDVIMQDVPMLGECKKVNKINARFHSIPLLLYKTTGGPMGGQYLCIMSHSKLTNYLSLSY